MPDDAMRSLLSPVSGRGGESMLFALLGSPMGERPTRPPAGIDVQSLFEFAFQNRVALMMLERCEELRIPLTESMQWEHKRLRERRRKTDAVIAKLSRALNEVAEGEWTLLKSMKPFPSTPNDTDWIPFDPARHGELCDHLMKSGFRFLEKAPLQTTLVEESGLAMTHSDKRGGVYYIDCYKMPGADYFVYLDPAKLRGHSVITEVDGVPTPTLEPALELITIMIHNVFPEKTYSIETFYLIMHYLSEIERRDECDKFVAAVRNNCCARAASANLAVTAALHQRHFGFVPDPLLALLQEFPSGKAEGRLLAQSERPLPYNFSNTCFWLVFLEKLRDPISIRSAFVQLAHMMNPFFFFDVMRIIWKRTRGGGIYKQM